VGAARRRELPPERRVLVTAHDAFNYFGRAYGFEVRGLQGISTAAEAGTADVQRLAAEIADGASRRSSWRRRSRGARSRRCRRRCAARGFRWRSAAAVLGRAGRRGHAGGHVRGHGEAQRGDDRERTAARAAEGEDDDGRIAIEVNDLTVAYREQPVLWDIDLAVPAGVLMAIVGPNGAGKTTLIKAMLGLLKPARARS
jgi:ATPase subunit of ABC transporter with duplicated ATPase domains